ncbi:dTDP-4-dehydrorhamnose reductase [Anaerocolumna aminovalerica]|uniref:dTDP-4-dehydrorhamnose reductase n=1 Tax=Anaerocolumna aminovalerica TaxID=1527 RepID=UPI001C0F327C|nr:dTDP-4-dehydrorhamnose reductase [Anaerocolumna aminovalerica]MBU5333654.1 dTDP-4-dehydrorhamnose reductase [Anaerocolumna aminovalerica]
MKKSILITGANGQLGRALNSVLKEQLDSDTIILNTSSREPTAYCPILLDITNPLAVTNIVQDLNPDIIVNCAAHTAVDLCESEKEKAYEMNALGPKNLAVAAHAIDAKFIHISTDYVFNGEKKTPYTEEDETNPQTVYGQTKLEGERLVQNHCEKFFIIRTAWLYGEGKNFVNTMLRLAEDKGEVGVVRDQFGTPTSAQELAKAIVFLMNTENYGLYHGTCEGIATWYEFATEIYRLAGKAVKVKSLTTDEYPTPAKRPKYSVLENKKLKELDYYMKPWKDALQEYMKDKI